ncbi:ABC transporter substrate-binding protein [Streptomyces cellostaticus]|uniref:Extracellular small neutral protease n=1 Tax=Streptomyces cellostaticus TaxID=67285 RepID=A0A101NLZ5_9ACTN|nr:snapalysin [Streptomyces cellostaticus]KUM95399.1 ABC transporter substrate-binding protein [Streptomyces cellostaticus]GHI01945.1 extracellular small neutral protease [Streptomyces cellostaticus]
MTSIRTSSMSVKASGRTLALGLGLALAALGTAIPASAQTPGPTAAPHARYTGSAEETANNKAFFEAVLTSVAKKQAAHPGLRSVTVSYDASQAPSFRSQIASAASIWNSSVSNVKLRAASGGADFAYYEGNDPEGSYASTDGHGNGYIFLDYAQNQEYDSIRVAAHETGHVLGLPDHYSGPCSELMSGGGPGPSCTNRYPNAAERARVNQLWANGLAKALEKLNKVH